MVTREQIAKALEHAFQDFGDEGGPKLSLKPFATGLSSVAVGISSRKRSRGQWTFCLGALTLRGITTTGLSTHPTKNRT